MAEYIPGTSVTRSAAISALSHAPKAPDDSEVDVRNSIMNVDYLSHEWQEEADVWASWRHTTRHKNDIANGVRLENASWRTWWKQRNHLKTVSPETLNWLKDSDVTWLYGPLHTAAEPVPPAKVATTEDRLDLSKATVKPILKHRSISELLSIPRGSSPSIETIQADLAAEDSDNERPILNHTKSESYITKHGVRRVSPSIPDIAHVPDLTVGDDGTESPRIGSDTDSTTSNKRHISFNTFVEQCISVDAPRNTVNGDAPWRVGFKAHYGYDEDDVIDEDDEDESTLLTMRSGSSSGQSSRQSSRRPSSSSRSNSMNNSEHVTIQPIAPTMLKTYDYSPGQTPAIVYVPPQGQSYFEDSTGSFGTASPSYATLHVGGHRPGMSTATRSQWEDEDEDRGVGFDFFGGPDVGVEEEYSATRSQNTQLGSGVGGSAHLSSQMDAVTTGIQQTTASPNTLISSKTSPPRSTNSSQSQVSSPRPIKAPGKSILKGNFPDAAIAETLRETVDKSDTYSSSNPATIPSPTSRPPVTVAPREVSIPTIEQPMPVVGEQTRGRSAIRIPGSGIVDRERSLSSKGSPIGSISPNSSRPPSRAIVIKSGASRASPPTTVIGRPSSDTSRSSPPPPGASYVPNPSPNPVVSSPSPANDFKPIKSSPVRTLGPKKRLSMDIVPVLPTQPAPAQLSPGVNPPSSSDALPSSSKGTTSRINAADNASEFVDEEGAPDNADGYSYHSTNPTPVNSPTASLRLLPGPGSNSNKDPGRSHSRNASAGSSTFASSLKAAPPSVSLGTMPGDAAARDAREDGTLVSRAADIVSSARGIFGAIWNAGVGPPAEPISSYPAVTGRNG